MRFLGSTPTISTRHKKQGLALFFYVSIGVGVELKKSIKQDWDFLYGTYLTKKGPVGWREMSKI